jgi:hypothetical protein
MRSVASTDGLPASVLSGFEESSEEENERGEYEPSKQGVVVPG